MSVEDFSFRAQAPTFQAHIGQSIPGYDDLMSKCIGLSRRFVRADTKVVDVGCSTGKLLHEISQYNASRSNVSYVGLDMESAFASSWDCYQSKNLNFLTEDVRTYAGYQNCSLVSSLFTLQFLKEGDRLPLLRRLHSGLIDGGAILVAEKVLARTSRLQDALTFPFYDYKLSNGFTEKEVLSKERELRGQMVLWTQDELEQVILDAGFPEYQLVWSNFPFIAILAMKASRAPLLDGAIANRLINTRSPFPMASDDRWSVTRRNLRAAIRQSPIGLIDQLVE